MNAIQFSKGGSPSDAPDSLNSEDVIEVLLGISRGPIKGLRNGPKSFMFDNTALVDVNNTPNFTDFQLDTWPGSPLGHTVKLSLGGFSSPVNIGQTLAPNIAVTRTGAQIGIDAADFRIVIGALYRSTDKGLRTTALQLKFEYKTISQATWSPAWVSTLGTDLSATLVGTAADQTFQVNRRQGIVDSFFGDRRTQTTIITPPADPTANPLAWDSTLHSWNTGTTSWESVPTTSYTGYVTFTDPASGEVRRVYDQQTVTTPADARVGDLWRFDGSKLLIWNGMAWVEGYSSAVQPPTIVNTSGIWSLDDKVTSTTPKDLRIFFPPTTELTQYRVTQLTTPAADVTIAISWESIQEIKRSAMTFTGTAMARLIGKASDQFTALPELSGIFDGRIVRVPSNYNEEARTYTGVWDGVYKMAFTNNPAWVFLDFVENDDFGLSSLYPHICNADKVYEWAQWCDVMVPRPDGTLRPRWTFNDYIREPREAREMAQYIAGAAGARYVDDGNGIVDIIIDKDQEAVCLFTLESVSDDGFSYSYTDPQTRANEVIVSFVNPDLEWSEDKRIVRNDASIADIGRVPLAFIAVACTDVDEATARARQRLVTGLTEKEFVTFKTNRKGRYLSEWDTILVADVDMGRGISGRVRAVTGVRAVSLRDPISFETGVTYVASFDTVNPNYPATSAIPYRIERRTITNGPGATSSLTFASDLPTLPEYANFSIEANGITGTPKPYKIVKIEIPDGSVDQITITALEVNRNKWAYIDTAEVFDPPAYLALLGGNVAQISNLRVVSTVKQIGAGSIRVLTLAWDRPTSAWVRRYRIVHSVDNAVVNSVETDKLMIDFERVDVGVHRWSVFAIDIEGRDSVPVSLAYEVVGEVRPVGPVSNLRMLDETSSSVFSSISPRFAWDAGDLDPNFSHYEMEIVAPGTNTRRRIETLGTEVEWSYDWEKQKADNAGVPLRAFEARLRRVDQYGNRSNPVAASVSNPTPAAPAGLTVTPTLGGFNITVTPPTERDVMGTLIWVTDTTGFDPLVVAPTYDGDQQSFYVPAAAGDTRFARAAFYDRYSKTPATLNICAQATGVVPHIEAVDLSTTLVAAMAADTATAVAAEAAVRASADTAAATTVTNLTATVGTNTTSITTQGTAIATLGQVYGTYGFSVNANGNIASMNLYAGSGITNTSGVKFEVGNFTIKSGTATGITPFTYDAVAGKLVLNSVVANDIAVGVLSGDEVSAAASITVGSGVNSITLKGTGDTRLFAGGTTPETAPMRITQDGSVVATKFGLRDPSGTVHWDSGLWSAAGLSAFHLAQPGTTQFTTAAGGSVGSLVTAPSTASNVNQPTGNTFFARLGNDSLVSIAVTVPLEGENTTDTFPATATWEILEAKQNPTTLVWDNWTSLGTKSLTKVTTGTPTSSQYKVSQFSRPLYNALDVVYGFETYYTISGSMSVVTLAVSSAAKTAGYYRYCVRGPAAAPWSAVSRSATVALTDPDGVPSFVLGNDASVAVNDALPLGMCSGVRMLQDATAQTTFSLKAKLIILYSDAGNARTLRNFAATPSMAALIGSGGNMDRTGAYPSTWLYVWAISNGLLDKVLLSLSPTNPIMPTGYSMKVLLGVVKNNAAGSALVPFVQNNHKWQYRFTSTWSGSTQTLVDKLPLLVNGAVGSNTATPPSYAAVVTRSESYDVASGQEYQAAPSIATSANLVVQGVGGSNQIAVASTPNYGRVNPADFEAYAPIVKAGTGDNTTHWLELLSDNIYVISVHADHRVRLLGFEMDV